MDFEFHYISKYRTRWGVFHHPCSDHIKINRDQTFHQMFISLNSGGMISVLSECTFSLFTDVVLLGSPAGDQLGATGNDCLNKLTNSTNLDIDA